MRYTDLLYIDKVPSHEKREFGEGVISVSDRLDINPNWLMAVINAETGGSFKKDQRNPLSTATGYIQFMSRTAKDLGTTTDALANMTPSQQLEYVYKYFLPKKNQLIDYPSVYRAVFYPASLGKDSDYELGGLSVARVNPAIANYIKEPYTRASWTEADGAITNEAFSRYAIAKIPEPWKTQFKSESRDTVTKMVGRNKWSILSGIVLVLVVGYIVMFKILKK